MGAMTLHSHEGFVRFVAGLPATTTVAQWGSLVAKVGGKVFCLRNDTEGAIAFKVSEIAFSGLIDLQGIGQAPYFAKGQWVLVGPGALEEALLAGYLTEAHRLIAHKLTRKARTELGL
jgi:predicted DNA-binding protein (MmcQ/YjbR family)